MGSTITHMWVQVYDYRYMITGIWLQVYDYRYMIADIWFQTYDMMTDIWLQTYDTHIWLSSKTLCLQTYDHIPPYMVFTYMILVHVYGTHICVCRHMIHIYVYLFPWDDSLEGSTLVPTNAAKMMLRAFLDPVLESLLGPINGNLDNLSAGVLFFPLM